MSFIAQIRLGDVPGHRADDHRLLSFHYCEACARDGRMPWGWPEDRNRGYNLSILDTSASPDGLGCVAPDWIGAQELEFESVIEIPDPGDLEPELQIPPDYFSYLPPSYDEYAVIPNDDVYPGLKHVSGTKLGGHPSWLQNPDWPVSTAGKRMQFIAQLDRALCSELAWASGTAFLFAVIDGPEETELVIQST